MDFFFSEGRERRAITALRDTSRWRASALRWPPRELGKTGSPGSP